MTRLVHVAVSPTMTPEPSSHRYPLGSVGYSQVAPAKPTDRLVGYPGIATASRSESQADVPSLSLSGRLAAAVVTDRRISRRAAG